MVYSQNPFGWPLGWPALQSPSWLGVWADAWSLTMEASSVIGLRTIVLASGGKPAGGEAFDMVSEKIDAGIKLHTKALTGGLGMTAASAARRIIEHYLPRVRANHKRLVRATR